CPPAAAGQRPTRRNASRLRTAQSSAPGYVQAPTGPPARKSLSPYAGAAASSSSTSCGSRAATMRCQAMPRATVPVQQAMSAAAAEELAVVEVVVLDRLGDPEARDPSAHLLELGSGFGDPPFVVGAQPGRMRLEQLLEVPRKHREPLVRDAHREHLVRVRRRLD